MENVSLAGMQALIDRIAIDEALSCYARHIDERAWDAYAALFTDEIELDFGAAAWMPSTRQQRSAWLDTVVTTASGFDNVQHIIANRIITIAGDEATARAHLVAYHLYESAERSGIPTLGGLYTFRLVRRAGAWKICGVALRLLWEQGDRALYDLAKARGSSARAG